VRKAAFLREAMRELGLAGSVEADRFEQVAAKPEFRNRFALLSVRAVRLDATAFQTISCLLKPGGHAALFRTVDSVDPPDGLPPELVWLSSSQLIPASHSSLTLLERST
jgi:16S rRNA G527 N7-methylase RsmG